MEWFYDSTTAQLYYIHNATGMPPENLNFEAVTTKGQKKIPSVSTSILLASRFSSTLAKVADAFLFAHNESKRCDSYLRVPSVLLNYSGTQSNPVVNVSVRGMTLRDTAYTYLDPHGAPSGGDW